MTYIVTPNWERCHFCIDRGARTPACSVQTIVKEFGLIGGRCE